MTMTPARQGLYDPHYEHDACGVSFVADLHGRSSHRIVELGLRSLCNLDHRGATNAEPNVGDGAGILVQVPDSFLRAVVDFELPPVGRYAVGMAFLPRDHRARAEAEAGIDKIVAAEGLAVLGWRDVPVDDSMIGSQARDSEPTFRQLFVADPDGILAGIELDRRCFVVRKRVEHEVGPALPGSSTDAAEGADAEPGVYFPSLSARTLVYKGMLIADQVEAFFDDLRDERVESALAAGPLALLDQHVPVLAAGAPVPLRRPQRRDQHGAGQRELDARPRGAAGAANCCPGSNRAIPDLHPRRERHRPLRRGARAAPPRRATACPTPC